MNRIRILSGGAAQGLVEALRPAFEAQTAHRIDGNFGAVGAMRELLLAGEPADVLILTRALIEVLARDGHVVAASMTDVGVVEIALAVRHGDPLPAIGDESALRIALLAADAIHLPDPQQATAGIHFAGVLRQLGISAQVANRLRPAPNGAAAMRQLAADGGRHPLGCTQVTEIIATAGVALVAPLPVSCALATTYTAAITTTARAPESAVRLVAMLTGEDARDHRQRAGFA